MGTRKLKMGHGNWVAGDRFWDREAELDLFSERIEEGANLLLVAQRRMGKTSLMREAQRRLEGRFACVYVDLQKAKDAPEAIVEIGMALRPLRGLWNKTQELFGNILSRVMGSVDKVELGEIAVTLRAGLTSGDWAVKGNKLFDILASSEKPVVLLLDEVPILVNRILKGGDSRMSAEGRSGADEFLSWLRENSIRHAGRIRMVLSGSIGLEPILHQAGLSATLNTFAPFELKPWEGETAISCLEALAREYEIQLEEGAAQEMVRRLGCCIPHHVQMFFAHVYDRCIRRDWTMVSPGEVGEVYEKEMLSVRGHAELTHYEERLKMVLGEERFPLALEMLSEAAVGEGLTRQALAALAKYYTFEGDDTRDVQRLILRVLEHDGYLEQTSGVYVFVSRLVRDWWEKRYGFLYTPVLRRDE